MTATDNQGQGTQQQGPEESRVFEPSAAFAAQATISGMAAYHAMVKEAETDYEGFWARLARENLSWKKPFTRTLNEDNAPFYKWFEDGLLNVSYNCLDRNIENGLGDKTAIIFEADDGTVTKATYKELHEKVCKFANGLKSKGIGKGDRVIIYMSMSVEGVLQCKPAPASAPRTPSSSAVSRPNPCRNASSTRAPWPSSRATSNCAAARSCP